MKFYTFAFIAILAVTMAPIPQVNAGLLDGILGGVTNAVGSTVGGVLNLVSTILLGGPRLSPNSKIVTARSSTGEIIGHFNGDFVSILQQLTTEPGETIYLRVTNNNNSIVFMNKSGKILLTLSGPKAQGLKNMALRYGGEIRLSLSQLGPVINGAQSILDASGQVIFRLTQSAVHDLGGSTVIVGNTLWDLTKGVNGLADGLLGIKNIVVGSGGLLNVIGNTVGGLAGGVGNVVGGLVGDVGNVVGGVGNTVGSLVGGVGNVVGGVGNTVGSLVGGVGNTVGSLVGGVGNAVGGIVNGVGNIVGGLVNTVGDILGVGGFARGSKIATLRRPDGTIIGHVNSDTISLLEQFITKPGESINFKVANNNTQLVITNKAGNIIFRLSGPKVQGLIQLAVQHGGEYSASLNHLGKLENGTQTVLDADNVVIDRVPQNAVHSLGGVVTIVGNNFWNSLKGITSLPSEILNVENTLVGSAIKTGAGVANGGLSLASNIINGILSGSHGVEKLDGSKVISIQDASNTNVGHLYGKNTAPIELLAKRLGGSITLKLVDKVSGSIAVLNQAGQIVGYITGSIAPKIKELVEHLGGDITLAADTIYQRLDKDGSKIISIVNATGSAINNLPVNAIHAINETVGNMSEKMMVIGNGLKGLDTHVSSLVPGVLQIVGSSLGGSGSTTVTGPTNTNENSNANADVQIGSPILAVRNKNGQYAALLFGGRFLTAIQEIFKQYGANIYLTIDTQDSGVVNVSNEAGKVVEQISGIDSLTKLVQQNGGKMQLSNHKMNVVTNNAGEKVVVAEDGNGNVAAVVSGNPISGVFNPTFGDKTYVVGNALIGSVLINGLLGGSGTVSTGGSKGGVTGGSNGWIISGSNGGGITSGSNGGVTGGITNGSNGWIISGVTGGPNGGITGGSNGGVTGGVTSGTTGGSNGWITGGGTSGSNGDISGGVTGGTNVGVNGGASGGSNGWIIGTSGSNGGITGDVTGGSDSGVTGATNGGVTSGSHGGLLGSLLAGSGSNGGLLGGLLGGSGSVSTGGSNGGLLGGLLGGSASNGGLVGGSGSVSTGGSNGGLLGGLLGGSGSVSTGGSNGGLLGGLLGGLTGGLSGGASAPNGGHSGVTISVPTGGSKNGGLLSGSGSVSTGGSNGGLLGGLLGGLTGGLSGGASASTGGDSGVTVSVSTGGSKNGGLLGGSGSVSTGGSNGGLLGGLLGGLTGGLSGGASASNGGDSEATVSVSTGGSNGGLLGGLLGGSSSSGGLLGSLLG